MEALSVGLDQARDHVGGIADDAVVSHVEDRRRRITVDGDDQGVSEGACTREQIQMAGMEKIKAAVGEHDFLSGGLEAARLLR